MREIKFRAWHKNRKTFLDFYWAVDKLGRTFSILDKYVYDEFTDEIELMQYTGLKDVHGIEIYEGDVVEFEVSLTRTKAEVKYSRNQFIVSMNSVMPRSLDLYLVKIIGNRFENPELLEVN
ncbi:YopX family protein [Latilactobacillus curvatus]|uniref:YopX family protein n=1 Tax=Latilactobacillus curvatus TaxID=28038 RepID=UPI0021A260CF|nr:YopX family protein [Latilactobacillus curvatus]MCT3526501.1 hypothetical protein [Latilactobacillus curvatus]MDG2986014.1 YopX family protein [Latilactobacillus curvatus]WCZ54789.1 putative sensor protein [Latilactobacillus phage TMW 1.591 P1]